MRKMLAVLGLVVLVGGACGKSSSSGSDSGTSAGGSPPVSLSGQVNNHGTKDVSAKGSSASLEVEQDDFYFGPTFIKAAPGQSLTIEVKNDGKVPHTFTTADGSVDEQLAPDATKTITVKAPASGALAWFCRFHQGQGMQGAVFLHAGDAVGAAGSGSSGSSTPSSTGAYGY